MKQPKEISWNKLMLHICLAVIGVLVFGLIVNSMSDHPYHPPYPVNQETQEFVRP
jgi:hypothetical protein